MGKGKILLSNFIFKIMEGNNLIRSYFEYGRESNNHYSPTSASAPHHLQVFGEYQHWLTIDRCEPQLIAIQ